LRDRRAGLKFRRQFPIGNYVVDFYCFEVRMAVELDGGAHAQPSQAKKDRAKDAYLTRLGVRVLRLPNGQVMEEDRLKDPSPGPLPDEVHRDSGTTLSPRERAKYATFSPGAGLRLEKLRKNVQAFDQQGPDLSAGKTA
jgi:hypothetical protein